MKFMTEWEQGFRCTPHNEKFCEQCNMGITFSSNAQWLGKTKKEVRVVKGKECVYQTYNGQIVSVGKHWENCSMPLTDMFELVSVIGGAIGPEIKTVEGIEPGTKSRPTFKSHEIVLVDIDRGLTIEELKQNESYLVYGAGFYTSPSHKPEHHKFRIIFVLDEPITETQRMEDLYTALIQIFNGDGQCHDAARLFFGTINAARREFDCSQRLPTDIVEALIGEVRKQREERMQKAISNAVPLTDTQKVKVLDLLCSIKLVAWSEDYPIYRQWRDITWALKESGYSFGDACSFAQAATSQKREGDVRKLWEGSSSGSNKVTMGTLMFYIEEYLGEVSLKEPNNTKQILITDLQKIKNALGQSQ